MSTKVAD